jgi:hypothetical protein
MKNTNKENFWLDIAIGTIIIILIGVIVALSIACV